MKELIYNYDNISYDDIDRKVKRAKIILEKENGDILLVKEYGAYQLPGGHLDPGENYKDALVREIKEEVGIEIENKERKPILIIRYLKENFPKENENTEFIGYYYYDKLTKEPDINNLNLTFCEKHSDFKLEFVNRNIILEALEYNLYNTEYKNTVSDTIEALKEYLKIDKKTNDF